MVPQGGNTSMVGGAVPSGPGQVVISLARMNRVRGVDPVDLSLAVEAGVTLKAAQEAAAAAGCLLPLSISSEGTAQVGGVLAANAGGNNTVRYGNARDLVLGLEAVLPDGSVWNGMRRLRKDNTGYSLRHLLIGSEGTLGIITAAVLKLSPQLREREVALCALPSLEAVLALFGRVQSQDAAALQAFEYMGGAGMAPGAEAYSGRHPADRAGAALRAAGGRHLPRAGRAAGGAGGGAGSGVGGWHRDRRRAGGKRGATAGAMEAARGALGGAETRRRVGEE